MGWESAKTHLPRRPPAPTLPCNSTCSICAEQVLVSSAFFSSAAEGLVGAQASWERGACQLGGRLAPRFPGEWDCSLRMPFWGLISNSGGRCNSDFHQQGARVPTPSHPPTDSLHVVANLMDGTYTLALKIYIYMYGFFPLKSNTCSFNTFGKLPEIDVTAVLPGP